MRLIVFLLCIAASAFSIAQSPPHLYEISGNGLSGTSYLFGSMHLNEEELFDFDDSLYYALSHCEHIAAEVDLGNIDSLMHDYFFDKMLKEADSDQDDEMIPDKKGRKKRKNGIQETFNLKGKPTFLDAYLFEAGLNMGLSGHGLEDFNQHFSLLDNMPAIMQESGFDRNSPELEKMIKIYLNDKGTELEEYVIKNNERLEKLLKLNSRNELQLNSFKDLAKNGSTFAIVGAAHLIGEGGLIEMLSSQGFNVRKVGGGKNTDKIQRAYENRGNKGWKEVESRKFPFSYQTRSLIPSKDFKGLAELSLTTDLRKGLIYMLMSFPSFLANPEALENQFMSEFAGGKSLKKSLLNDSDTLRVAEFGGLSKGFPARIRITSTAEVSVIQFVLGFSEKALETPETDFFLSGLNFTPQKPKDSNWKKRISDDGSLAYYFPESIAFQTVSVPHPTFPERGEITLRYATYSESGSNNVYMIRYNGLIPGLYYPDPFTALRDQVDQLALSQKGNVTEFKTSVENNVPVAYAIYREKNAYFSHLKLYIRGSFSYLALQRTQSESPNLDFFESFKLSGLAEEEMTDFVFEKAGFSALVPDKMFEEEVTSYLDENNSQFSFSSQKGGMDVQISFTPVGKYDFYDSSTTKYSKESVTKALWSDSILSFTSGKLEDLCPYYEVSYSRDSTYLVHHELVTTCNNYEIKIDATIPLSLVGNVLEEEFFNGLNFNADEEMMKNYSIPKSAQLIIDLSSNDSLLRAEAQNALSLYEGFTQNDFSGLLNLLNNDFKDESVRPAIVRQIFKLNLTDHTSQLINYYDEKATSEVRSSFVMNESRMDDSLHYFRLFHFLENTSDNSEVATFQLFGTMNDSLAEFSAYFPRVKNLIDKGMVVEEGLDLVSIWRYKESVPDFLKKEFVWFDQQVHLSIENFLGRKHDEQTYLPLHIRNYYENCDNGYRQDEVEAALLKTEDYFSLFQFIVDKLDKQVKVSQDLLSKSLEGYYAYETHRAYADHEKKMPSKYANEKELAKAVFITFSYDFDDFLVDKPSLVDTYKEHLPGFSESNMYIFKARLKYDDGFIIGLVGPFKNGVYLENQSRTYFNYYDESLSLRENISYLKSLVNEE